MALPTQGSSPHTRGTLERVAAAGMAGRDHPRIRGEHEAMTGEEARASGIIPAYAGNTTVLINRLLEAEGSSPHTRGTLIYLRSQFPARQFCITLSKATGLVPLACIAPA